MTLEAVPIPAQRAPKVPISVGAGEAALSHIHTKTGADIAPLGALLLNADGEKLDEDSAIDAEVNASSDATEDLAASTIKDEADHPRPDTQDVADAEESTWQLVTRVQEGDRDAFDPIYRKYLAMVFRFVNFRVPSREIAEDLTAETFARALRRIHSVTDQGKDLGAWLITIARNIVTDHYKSGRSRFEMVTSDVLEFDKVDLTVRGSPERAVIDHITNVTLRGAVMRLKPEQRACIMYRFFGGLSVTETAQVMGKNDGAIKALQYRAVNALRRLLPEGFLLQA